MILCIRSNSSIRYQDGFMSMVLSSTFFRCSESTHHTMPCIICIIFSSRTSRRIIKAHQAPCCNHLSSPLTGRPVAPRFALDSRLAGIVLSTLVPLRPVDPIGPVLQKVSKSGPFATSCPPRPPGIGVMHFVAMCCPGGLMVLQGKLQISSGCD